MKAIPLDNKSALNKVKGRFPFTWDLNIYRGCMHGCKYCYAIYSHSYLDNENFFGSVYYKKNILECLERELSSPKWKREVVNIGGVTDSYQPIEKELKLMPEILKLMIKYKTPVIISTKSDLILRDIDLIKELSDITYVNIAFTITTADEKLRRKLEPGASPSVNRFRAIKKLKSTNACLGVHMMPIIPYLTDSKANIDTIYKYAKIAGADYVLPGTLYLRGKTKPYFLKFVKNYNYDIYLKVNELYKKGGARKDYKDYLYKKVNDSRKKYGLSSDYMSPMKNKLKEK